MFTGSYFPRRTTSASGVLPSINLTEYAKKTDLTEYAKKTDLDEYAKDTDLNAYAKTDDIPEVPVAPDLSNYALKNQLDTKTSAADVRKMIFGDGAFRRVRWYVDDAIMTDEDWRSFIAFGWNTERTYRFHVRSPTTTQIAGRDISVPGTAVNNSTAGGLWTIFHNDQTPAGVLITIKIVDNPNDQYHIVRGKDAYGNILPNDNDQSFDGVNMQYVLPINRWAFLMYVHPGKYLFHVF
jgi:hypothetical protein